MEPVFLFILVVVFSYGAILGSFFNVIIYRLPRELSVVFPPSSCPSCRQKIKWWQNIPLFSYLLLLGKCNFCKWPIPFRYTLVEAISGFSTVFIYTRHPFLHFLFAQNGSLLRVNISWENVISFIYYMIFVSLLIIIYFIDLDWQVIFDLHSVGGAIVGFIGQLYYSITNRSLWLDSLIGIIAGALFFYIIAVISGWVFKKEAMGGGDVKFAALIGAFLGWKLAFVAFFLSFLIGSIWGITLILLRLKQRKDYIPFGPSMALGAFAGLFWGERLMIWYFELLRGGLY